MNPDDIRRIMGEERKVREAELKESEAGTRAGPAPAHSPQARSEVSRPVSSGERGRVTTASTQRDDAGGEQKESQPQPHSTPQQQPATLHSTRPCDSSAMPVEELITAAPTHEPTMSVENGDG